MFDSELLRTFVAVADNIGFTRAAEQLNMSQSAVSVQIRRLEEQVGVRLLERTTRKVMLTQQGEILLGYARSITSLQEEVRSRLSPGACSTGKIMIGTSEDFAQSHLPHVLRRFSQSNPDVTLEVQVGVTADLVNALDRGRLDLVVGKHCGQLHSDRGETLWQEQLVWAYAAHTRLDARHPIPLAFFPEPCAYRDAALKALAKSKTRWRVALVSPSVAGVRAAAAAGFAVTPLTSGMVDRRLRAVSEDEGLPALPRARFVMYTGSEKTRSNKAQQQLAALIRKSADSPCFIQAGTGWT